MSRKTNLVKAFTHYAFMLCSKCKLDAELKQINTIFLAHGHPESVIKTNIKLKISKFNETKTFRPRKCLVYIKLP